MSQTDKDWQIAALKQRAAHAEEQAQYFNKAGQHWARNLGTAEVLLREIIDFYGDFPINDGVDATFRARVERCLPGFWDRTTPEDDELGT
jgi:hypothetical protein